jgi:hypothetical protein
MILRFENKGVVLHFDDYDIQKDGSAWSRVCANCRDRYRDTLGDRTDESGEAMGTCGIFGCDSEADDYVDFAADEIAEVTELPAVSDKYTVFEDTEAVARYLLSAIQKGRVYSVYGWDNLDGRWNNETVVAKVAINGIDVIVADSRYGHAPFVSKECDFAQSFPAYLHKNVGERIAAVPFVAMRKGKTLSSPYKGKHYSKKDLENVSLPKLAEWLGNQDADASGFSIGFMMEKNRKDRWLYTALYPLGDFNIAVISGGDMLAALTHRKGYNVGEFASALVAVVHTTGCRGDEIKVTPPVAEWIMATNNRPCMDAEAFMDYIKANFTLDITTQWLVKNVITYTELFKEHSDKWDFIQAMLDGTGVDLSREEIEMFE